MKLIDVVKNIETIDDGLIIFQKNVEDQDSDVILSFGEKHDQGVKVRNGEKYYYLIEVFLAKEFISDLLQNVDQVSSNEEIAKKVFEYAINDA